MAEHRAEFSVATRGLTAGTRGGQKFAAERYCDVCREGEKAEDTERQSYARCTRVRVPSAYDACSFDTFEPVPGTATALAVCRQWAKELRVGTNLRQGLLLRGNPGAGKTHLAVAILREVLASDRRGQRSSSTSRRG
jgi:DNA replication protein DnaC